MKISIFYGVKPQIGPKVKVLFQQHGCGRAGDAIQQFFLYGIQVDTFALCLKVTVYQANRMLVALNVLVHFLGDHHRSVHAAGTPDGDGEIGLAFLVVTGHQVVQQIEIFRQKSFGVRVAQHIGLHLFGFT